MSTLKRQLFIAAGFLFLAALVLVAAGARAASFTASLDRDTIALGETATLSLSFEGAQPNNVPTPGVSGLQIVNSGTSQNVSFINGAMSSTVTVNFSITPQHEGEFTIPAMTVDINGQTLTSRPLKLTVQKNTAPTAAAVGSDSQVAFMKLALSVTNVYVGESIVGQVQLFFRDDVQNFGNFQFTATPVSGLNIGKMAQQPQHHTQIGNRVYTVIPISIAFTAMKTGDLSLGPFAANMVILLPPQNQGDNPLAQFFNQGEQRQISLTTDEVKIQSLPLPTENAPANFNGAIGDYQMTVTAGPTNVTVGDPITVRMQISGRGSFDAIKLPDQSAWNDFKIFPPTSKTETSDPLGLEGTKTFEEIVTPENTDVRALPEFSFSFFNPDDGQYHTLTQPPEALIVHSGSAAAVPTIAATKNSTPENQSPQDIFPIKENLGTLAKNSEPLISQPAFLALQTLPILAFLAALIWRKHTDNLANNPRLRRKIAVEKLIQNGISDLRKFAAQNNSEEFFALLFRLLQEQLGERLDCPATAITENVVEENSFLRGTAEKLRSDLRELFQLCNQARYAPVRGTSELTAVVAQFERTIDELQNLKA